jgi:hypothetical protein
MKYMTLKCFGYIYRVSRKLEISGMCTLSIAQIQNKGSSFSLIPNFLDVLYRPVHRNLKSLDREF